MSRLSTTIVLAIACAVGLTSCATEAGERGFRSGLGQEAELFEWEGSVAAGHHVEVKGINGAITAHRSTNGLLNVSAVRQGQRNDPNEVRIDVVEHSAGVTVCAVYPRDGNKCLPGDQGRLSARRHDVTVSFTVALPEAVDLVARTINGSVTASGLTDDVWVHTVSGAVDVSTEGHVHARTVNGSIQAAMGRAEWEGDIALETVNGSVTIWLPDTADTDLRFRTVNGSSKSDLALNAVDADSRRLNGKLGDGGGMLRVKTVNGSVRLRDLKDYPPR